MDSSMSNQEGLAEDVALSTCKQGLEPLMHTEAGSAFELPVAIGLPVLISLRMLVAVTLQADARSCIEVRSAAVFTAPLHAQRYLCRLWTSRTILRESIVMSSLSGSGSR